MFLVPANSFHGANCRGDEWQGEARPVIRKQVHIAANCDNDVVEERCNSHFLKLFSSFSF